MKSKTLFLFSSLAILSSCGPSKTSTSNFITNSSFDETPTYKYTRKEMYQNFLKDKTIYNETVLLLEKDGEISANLLYKPTNIISVRDYTLNVEYDTSNYKIEGQKILRTENSTLPYFTKENLLGNDLSTYGIEPTNGKTSTIPFTEGPGIVMHQINVTYQHEDSWDKEVPSYQGNILTKTIQKLKNKEHLVIGFYGDSIMTGCNSSGKLGIQPYLDDFPTASVDELKEYYNYDNIEMFNSSKGGMLSDWGATNVDSLVNVNNPDLVFIGFGMNDGSWNVKPDTFINNIETIINRIQLHNSNAEIVVVSTILANPDSIQNSIQESYLEPLKTMISNYDGVALMDMTTYSKNLLSVKNSLDMYANNINHPSDFLVRGYVSNILSTLVEEY